MNQRNSSQFPQSVEQVEQLLADQDYIAERGLAVCLLLALKLTRPIFLEGEPGVGKTELAKALANALQTKLIRLQCYEGIDLSTAAYEWNYPAQMLAINLLQSSPGEQLKKQLYTEEFLIKRPLLEALQPGQDKPAVLLIDELDRADEPFEAFLLELLAEYQLTIPELGSVKAAHPPIVIITSNRTREIHDAVKRRCFYHWLDYPDATREYLIVKSRLPRVSDSVNQDVVAYIHKLRDQSLYKKPGVTETIDLASAMCELGIDELDVQSAKQTLGVVLKYQDDIEQIDEAQIAQLLNR